MKNCLSIITIAYEDDAELKLTYDSIKTFIEEGTKWILIISQGLRDFKPPAGTVILERQDTGLYDALNIGLDEVCTEFFMLLHSGDTIFNVKAFEKALKLMNSGYDCVLGGAVIGNRLHKSRKWRTWMLKLYVQPPHLPIIYKSESSKEERYNTAITTVADFYYLRELFSKLGFSYIHSNEVYVRMGTGGLTTSGFKSFLHVTFSFIRVDGIKPFLLSPIRLILKFLIK